MSRGAQENQRVRAAIVRALFSLMDEKGFSKITVSDIVARAEVARVSYYRNFNSKEEVIEEYIDSLYRGLIASAPQQELSQLPTSRDMLSVRFESSFAFLAGQRRQVLGLYDSGFGTLVLDVMNRHTEEMFGGMPSSSPERYGLYLATGAAFNVLIRWLREGMRETPHELAATCASFVAASPFGVQKRPSA